MDLLYHILYALEVSIFWYLTGKNGQENVVADVEENEHLEEVEEFS